MIIGTRKRADDNGGGGKNVSNNNSCDNLSANRCNCICHIGKNDRTNNGLPPVQAQRDERTPCQEGCNVTIDQQPWNQRKSHSVSSVTALIISPNRARDSQ